MELLLRLIGPKLPEEETLFLLNNTSKTGYDKYEVDANDIQKLYEAVEKCVLDGKETIIYNQDYGVSLSPITFLEFYSKHPEYDKREMLKKAELLSNLYEAEKWLVGSVDTPEAIVHSRSLFRWGEPEWRTDVVEHWFDNANDRIERCSNFESSPTFGTYFAKLKTKLIEKRRRGEELLDVQREQYHRELTERQSSRSESSYSSSSSKSDIDPDVSLSSIGISYETTDWETKWDVVDFILNTSDDDRTLYMKVTYSDGTKGLIIKYPQTDYYQPLGGEGFFFDDKYDNLNDAIAAEYFFKKYKKTRNKGKKIRLEDSLLKQVSHTWSAQPPPL